MTASITVILPTQRRPEGLARAARSIFAQEGVATAGLELLVADNDAAPSAAGLVAALAAEAPFPVRYVHEPAPGVANVRNAALAASEGQLIAFLDDDEEASPGWLAALLDAQSRLEADVVFGPVRTFADWPRVGHRTYLEQFFAREGPAETGVLDRYYGCGNSLIVRAALPDPNRPFSKIRNEIGGEDDLLFGAMQKTGARFAWSAEAWVWEHPAPERLTLRYALRRAFAFGQGASAHCAASRDWLGLMVWMATGLPQAAVFGALAFLKRLAGSPDYVFALDRAARGLGKTFWGRPFKIRFYGHRAPAAPAVPALGPALGA